MNNTQNQLKQKQKDIEDFENPDDKTNKLTDPDGEINKDRRFQTKTNLLSHTEGRKNR